MREANRRSAQGAAAVYALVLLASAPAPAFELTQVGGPTVVNVGESFTIELALENASREPVQGIEVDLGGLAGTAVLTSGRAARFYFAQFCAHPNCFGAVEWIYNAFLDRNDLASPYHYTPGDNAAHLIRALSLAATTADGSLDPGVDLDGSPVDVRITLQAIGLGELTIVGRYSNGTDVLPISGSPLTIRVVPEPGTALLVGLGLGGMAGMARMRCRAA